MLGALFPPNGRYALLVALTPSLDLFICAKDLFVEAKPLTWLHRQHSGAEGFSLPRALGAHSITSSTTPVRYWINFVHTAKYKIKPHAIAINTNQIAIFPQLLTCP